MDAPNEAERTLCGKTLRQLEYRQANGRQRPVSSLPGVTGRQGISQA